MGKFAFKSRKHEGCVLQHFDWNSRLIQHGCSSTYQRVRRDGKAFPETHPKFNKKRTQSLPQTHIEPLDTPPVPWPRVAQLSVCPPALPGELALGKRDFRSKHPRKAVTSGSRTSQNEKAHDFPQGVLPDCMRNIQYFGWIFQVLSFSAIFLRVYRVFSSQKFSGQGPRSCSTTC